MRLWDPAPYTSPNQPASCQSFRSTIFSALPPLTRIRNSPVSPRDAPEINELAIPGPLGTIRSPLLRSSDHCPVLKSNTFSLASSPPVRLTRYRPSGDQRGSNKPDRSGNCGVLASVEVKDADTANILVCPRTVESAILCPSGDQGKKPMILVVRKEPSRAAAI